MPSLHGRVGSISKEFPIHAIDQTLLAIRRDMPYPELRDYAQHETNINIAAILGQRFLLIKNNIVTYDLFLSLLPTQKA